MAIDPQWIQAGSQVLSSVLKPPASGDAISGSTSYVNQDFDFSGFTVGTGSAKVTGAPNNKTTGQSAGAPAASGSLSSALPVLMVGLAALAGFIWG